MGLLTWAFGEELVGNLRGGCPDVEGPVLDAPTSAGLISMGLGESVTPIDIVVDRVAPEGLKLEEPMVVLRTRFGGPFPCWSSSDA